MSSDIVSVIKHTDCEAALVSATFQLKLLGKSARCCRNLLGFDYSMWCDLLEQHVLNETKTSNKWRESQVWLGSVFAGLSDFMSFSLLSYSHFVSCPQRQYGATAVNTLSPFECLRGWELHISLFSELITSNCNVYVRVCVCLRKRDGGSACSKRLTDQQIHWSTDWLGWMAEWIKIQYVSEYIWGVLTSMNRTVQTFLLTLQAEE